jgi:hypothetical protein
MQGDERCQDARWPGEGGDQGASRCPRRGSTEECLGIPVNWAMKNALRPPPALGKGLPAFFIALRAFFIALP